jgi:hypothetical protein
MPRFTQSLALATAMLAAAAASPASAGTPTGSYLQFRYCPYATNPDVATCVYNVTRSGSFKLGNSTVPIVANIVLQGGVQSAFVPSPVYPAVGAPSLSPTPLPVPGGLLGIANPAPDWPFPLWVAFWSIVNSVNDVTATAEPAAAPSANLVNALFPPLDGSDSTVITLPIRVRLSNPLLGNTCYIGSVQQPIVLKLTAATTNPPPPAQPISGVPATFSLEVTTNPDGTIIHALDGTLVDNAFAVPAARGCGNVALGLPIITQVLDALVSGAVNLKVGLPSAAGKNTAIMVGDTAIAAAEYVIASEH